MSASEQGSTFEDTLQKFVEENRLEPIDRELLTHERLEGSLQPFAGFGGREVSAAEVESVMQAAQARRDRTAMAIDLLAIRAAEKQAESQDKHAEAMRWFTMVLVFIALVQALPMINEAPTPLAAIGIGVVYTLLLVIVGVGVASWL